jgi:NTE family protein
MSAIVSVPREADAVFEGGGVKGIALVGGISAAERAGVERWVNVAGTSAGAIVAAMLAVGYRSERQGDTPGLRDILAEAQYARFADFGFGGLPRGLLNSLYRRGLAPGRYFRSWLAEWIEKSPLARELGKERLTFADVVRHDLPDDITEEQRRRARYRLRVITSNISCGRMMVLPDDIEGFSLEEGGEPCTPDAMPIVDAVRMSMSYPFLFTPVPIWDARGRMHLLVDGGLLSNFPVWLFDSGGDRPPARPTWGFRLHGGEAMDEDLPYRRVPMPFWRLKLARAMFQAATEAWDRTQLGRATSSRTVSIPTRSVGTTDFGLSREQADSLYRWGVERADAFFGSDDIRMYLVHFERRRAATEPELVDA